MSDDARPEDSEPDKGDKLRPFPNPPVADSPVVPLGYYDDRVVFCMPEGQLREVKAQDVGKLLKVDIYNRKDGRAFLNNWLDDELKFKREQAAIWFVEVCREAGYWDRSRPQRGLGVWPGRGGAALLHRGQEVWSFARDPEEPPTVSSVAEIMRAKSGPVYALAPAAPAPDDPSTAEDGSWVLDKLRAWHFELIGEDGLSGVDVVAGWTMCAMLGAVAPFRPHLLLYAMFGSGKSTLIEFVHGLLSAVSGDVIDRFTAAGLANDLAGMARPVIIDEAEASPSSLGPGPVEQAMELLRRMATGQGSTRKMGTVGGKSVTQTAVGAVMLGAINPVKLTSQDASRITEIKLRPLNAKPDDELSPFRPSTDAEVKKAIRAAVMLSPNLLGRALRHAGRYVDDVATLKDAFKRQGLSPRAADLVSALAAGRRLLTSDDPLDDDQADAEALLWRGLVTAREATGAEENVGEKCFAHLMSWPSGKHKWDRIVTLGELVADWAQSEARNADSSVPGDTLKTFGLKPEMLKGDDGKVAPWLLVANNSPKLTHLFDKTPFGDWRKSLGYLEEKGARYKPRGVGQTRFGTGLQQRALAVPLAPWLDELQAADPEASR